MKFYAHSTEQQNKSDWQGLSEHLTSVGDLAEEFAAHFGAQKMARTAGLLHDLGKYTQEFQKRLEGGPRVDHSAWGARVVLERYEQLGQLLAYTIAGHHAGLADGRVADDQKRTSLADRLAAGLPELLNDWEKEIALPSSKELNLPEGFKPRPDRGMFQLSLLVRMIFSCLVDADFIDTDEFYRQIEGKAPRRGIIHPAIEQLRECLDQYLAKFRANSDVNRLRAEILGHVRGRATHDPGLFSLTVPTGGGKTLASLAFALDHAIEHDLQRVIYVIPFTSIVEQNAQVFREAFGDLGEAAVLEHHSAFFDDPDKAPESKEKRKLAMENWDAPIVVTTAVQFFESLFADRPSHCRKLHNIAGSVVILDEAQTLPIKLLRPCVTLLDELALNYKTSIVLCTATQPALREDQGFSNGLKNVHELAPNPPVLYEKLRRVNVRHIGSLSDDDLANQLRQRDQVLCIVNNRRHARALYETIADHPGARHLTTLMYAKHRRTVLEQVRIELKEEKPCRLVSTSLIEAGVDIDFPTVLRAEAGLDSIAQAAGRCNREGRRSREASETLVFATNNSDWAPPTELAQFAQVFRSIERRHADDLLALDAVHDYFRELYWQKGDAELDAKGLLELLRQSSPESLPLESLARNFQFIETSMRPIIVPFVPGTDRLIPAVAEALDKLEYAPGLARLLQPYLVQVPQNAFKALQKFGAIHPVAEERYGEQFMRLVNPDLYDEKFGLHWDDPAFIKAERLVV
ncbi:CRISPR-associated endonuclease Cas3'' [Porticoccus sp.]|uniref:CRISPR-associated endonuclease Cas3'' n=1 Tax=Porticoccus sp. TaxID=2024853 RepID=UPI000C44CC64|nr:CRISPR-associated endonuclease Cas3'' [Porticoccus sp.]MAZ69986.1 CRISPR-associated helicase/endonuclease Cas3 [Porticoccus sp.]|tara:strand:- start:14939 stop:17176 length:2238 start_codon:yes stop_codon:yes gene_type:complete